MRSAQRSAHKGVIIAGYYGANNTGDEAILSGMLRALRAEGIADITVLSRNPAQTARAHGVKSHFIGRRFDGLLGLLREIRRHRLFILGGGGLLQDGSRRVVPFWLSRVLLALLAGVPVMYYAQGIGPLRTAQARRLVRLVSNRVRWITVRDQDSALLLQELGVARPRLEITADPALGIEPAADGPALLERAGALLASGKSRVAVALRSWKGEEAYLPVIIDGLKRLREQRAVQYVFFPFQPGEDLGVCRRVMQAVDAEDARLVEGDHTPEEMAAMLREMDGIIAMRLHAVILGAISLIPSFGLVYDPKVLHFMERVGTAAYSSPLEDLTDGKALAGTLANWLDTAGAISRQMQPQVEVLQKLALRNAEIARQLIRNS